MLLLISAFQAFDEFYNLLVNAGGGSYPPYARPPLVYLYYVALGRQQDFGHGSAGAVILTVIIAMFTLVQGRLFGFGRREFVWLRSVPPVRGPSPARRRCTACSSSPPCSSWSRSTSSCATGCRPISRSRRRTGSSSRRRCSSATSPTLFDNRSVPFLRSLRNSAIVSVLQTAGAVLVASMAGYGLARIPYRFANAVFVIILVTLMIPAAVTFVPSFIIVVRDRLARTPTRA